MRPSSQPVISLIALALVAGCHSTVKQPTEPRPATNPTSLRLFQKEPHTYEDLGDVEVAGAFQYGPDSTATAVVEELKAKAAAKGANALWLFRPRGPDMVGFGAFYNDHYYIFPFRRSQPPGTLARAIYILE